MVVICYVALSRVEESAVQGIVLYSKATIQAIFLSLTR